MKKMKKVRNKENRYVTFENDGIEGKKCLQRREEEWHTEQADECERDGYEQLCL
jgi:hypothetical protein